MLAVLLTAIFLLLHSKRLGYADVGLSYQQVVVHRELWRSAASQLAHVDLLHLVFNLSVLWSIGMVERTSSLGTLYYLQQTTLLFLLSPAVSLPPLLGCLPSMHALRHMAGGCME